MLAALAAVLLAPFPLEARYELVLPGTRNRRLQTENVTCSSPCSGGDIQAALNDASVSRIVLAAGTYALGSTLTIGTSGNGFGRNVTIEAEVPGSVVLHGQGSQVLSVYAAGHKIELIGINITGGVADTSGGVYIYNGDVSFVSCNIYDNAATNARARLPAADPWPHCTDLVRAVQHNDFLDLSRSG